MGAACAKTGDAGAASAWLDRMEAASVTPNTISFTNAIRACINVGRALERTAGKLDSVALAEDMFQRMLDMALEPDKVLEHVFKRAVGEADSRHCRASVGSIYSL